VKGRTEEEAEDID
jgi:hypothetical protein